MKTGKTDCRDQFANWSRNDRRMLQRGRHGIFHFSFFIFHFHVTRAAMARRGSILA